MAKGKASKSPDSVDNFIKNLEPALGRLVNKIREIIMNTDSSIGEQIKWNSPAFFYTGEMKAFNPKEYKRDLLVINTQKNKILLVFPTGAGIQDATGILQGDYTDGRRLVSIVDEKDLAAKEKQLQSVIRNWLLRIEKPGTVN